MTKKTALKTNSPTQTGQVRVEWLYGAGCAQFITLITFGRSVVHRVKAKVRAPEIAEAARGLLERPDCLMHAFHGGIRRGRGGWHDVQIPVPRSLLLDIASALAGAIDDDDAGHRFYHWESPSSPRPCSSCRETRGADDARVDVARAQFILAWAGKLGVGVATIEQLLSEHMALPTKALR